MTPEKLERALALSGELDRLKDQKAIWEEAIGFQRPAMGLSTPKRSDSEVETNLIPFEEMQALMLSEFDRLMAPLQAEFDEL